jgi:TAT (twin-arginine translocation) pathway signal sequence
MNRRSLMQFSGLAGAATLLSGCWLFPAEWKRKLTVTISSPSGEKSASVVQAQSLSEDPVTGAAHSTLKGEAVVLEVTSGKYLFALIQENKPQTELIVFPGEAPLVSTHNLSGVVDKVFQVPQSAYPMLVTFTDINDPKSVKEVKPSDLAATFGAGFALKSITLEITDEKVIEGVVVSALPWIKGFNCAFVPSVMKPADQYTLAETMSVDKFFMGVKP